MDERPPTVSVSAPPRYRWVWRVCLVVLFLGLAGALYRVMTMEPALYSPVAAVRSNSDYTVKMNPTRLSEIKTQAPAAVMPQVTGLRLSST